MSPFSHSILSQLDQWKMQLNLHLIQISFRIELI